MTAATPQPALARIEERLAALEATVAAMPDVIAARIIADLVASMKGAKADV
jgi:hypothetical protein